MSATLQAAGRLTAGSTRLARCVVYLRDDDYPWDVRAEKICLALTGAGHEVHVVAHNKPGRAEREQLPEGTVHRMPRLSWLPARINAMTGFPAFFNPRWIAHLRRVVRSTRADAIIVRDLPLALTAHWCGKRFGIPVLLDMAENYPAMTQDTWDAGRQRAIDHLVRNPRLVAAVERKVLPLMDAVLTVVEESATRVKQLGVRQERVFVVSNTPPAARAEESDEPHVVPHADHADQRLKLVYLGLLEIPRGVGELIDAVAMLRARGVPVHATIIGDGRDAAIFREQAKTRGLGSDVFEFTGYVARDEALRLVSRADIGIVPHHATALWNSTIPNKLFDYMAAGLPVVTSSAVPAARIVRESGAGEVFRAGDAASLTESIRALESVDARTERGEAGRRAVRERYNWERDTSELLTALEQVTSAASSPAAR